MITENPKEFWNGVSLAPNWKEYILPKRSPQEFDEEGQRQSEFFKKFFSEDEEILEYGCGIGRVLKYLRAKRKIGIDICDDYIRKAKEIDRGSEYFVAGEFSGQVDFIYCLYVLQHNTAPERMKIIREIYRLLKPGGRCFISFPNKKSANYRETQFVHVFTAEEVEEYGKIFKEYSVTEGNFIKYGDGRVCEFNEYFLEAKK